MSSLVLSLTVCFYKSSSLFLLYGFVTCTQVHERLKSLTNNHRMPFCASYKMVKNGTKFKIVVVTWSANSGSVSKFMHVIQSTRCKRVNW